MNRQTMSLLAVIAINLAACCVGGVTPKKQAAVTDKQVKTAKNDDANYQKKENAKDGAEKDDFRDQLIPFLTKH